MSTYTPDPALDLVLERTIPVSPERVWAAWTRPELLMQWFTPAPWKTVAADLDLRVGDRVWVLPTHTLSSVAQPLAS